MKLERIAMKTNVPRLIPLGLALVALALAQPAPSQCTLDANCITADAAGVTRKGVCRQCEQNAKCDAVDCFHNHTVPALVAKCPAGERCVAGGNESWVNAASCFPSQCTTDADCTKTGGELGECQPFRGQGQMQFCALQGYFCNYGGICRRGEAPQCPRAGDVCTWNSTANQAACVRPAPPTPVPMPPCQGSTCCFYDKCDPE